MVDIALYTLAALCILWVVATIITIIIVVAKLLRDAKTNDFLQKHYEEDI